MFDQIESPTTMAEAREPLPDDLLLEIAARADLTTVVRFAAASKPLRRGILGPGFRHRLGRAFLLGFSFRPRGADRATMIPRIRGVETTAARPLPRVDSALLQSHEPVASRDGLLVLRRWDHDRTGAGLSVYDTLTHDVTSLPPMDVYEYCCFPPALLGAGGRSFELLAADSDQETRLMRIQIFSSKNGTWGAARAVPYSEEVSHLQPLRHPAVVAGRLTPWLCHLYGETPPLRVLAVDADTAAATSVQLPPSYSRRMHSCSRNESQVLLALVGGRLSLLVAETVAVSVWTLTTTTTTWDRQVVVGVQQLERRAGLQAGTLYCHCPIVLFGFAEKSEAVVVLAKDRDMVSVNLGTKAVTTLWRGQSDLKTWFSQVCLHEIDLATVLQDMKPF